jgi:hypothetical protein
MISGMQPEVSTVIEGELALLAPAVRRSATRVGDLLDPEFREIGASGRLWTRPEIIAALAGEDVDADPFEATDMVGRVIGPGFVLLTYASRAGDRRTRRSSLSDTPGSNGDACITRALCWPIRSERACWTPGLPPPCATVSLWLDTLRTLLSPLHRLSSPLQGIDAVTTDEADHDQVRHDQ